MAVFAKVANHHLLSVSTHESTVQNAGTRRPGHPEELSPLGCEEVAEDSESRTGELRSPK